MKVVSVVGARPQFIKLAVVSRAMAAAGDEAQIAETIIHTGQHFDPEMSEVFFDELGIPQPHYNLGVASLGHGAMTGRMLQAIEELLVELAPDWVVVYGDTNSTLAGALAAAKLQIPLAHVEAGVRSFNRAMPEEINRVLADHACDLLLCPSPTARDNLQAEGFTPGPDLRAGWPAQAGAEPYRQDIRRNHPLAVLVGDVMYDAALYHAERGRHASRMLAALGLEPGGYCLATVHRQENTDQPGRLSDIFTALAELADDHPVVTPLHPRTRARLAAAGRLAEVQKRLRVIDPVGYGDMAVLEKNAGLIITDSGGVQREAFFYARPCLTLRRETEWVELLGAGHVLAPGGAKAIVESARRMFGRRPEVDPGPGPYGDGTAGEKIVRLLVGARLV